MKLLLSRVVQNRNIRVENNRTIDRIEENKVIFDNGDSIDADCIVWATGAEPHDFQHNMTTCENGWLLVNDNLQSVSNDNVFAGGDCITIRG